MQQRIVLAHVGLENVINMESLPEKEEANHYDAIGKGERAI